MSTHQIPSGGWIKSPKPRQVHHDSPAARAIGWMLVGAAIVIIIFAAVLIAASQ